MNTVVTNPFIKIDVNSLDEVVNKLTLMFSNLHIQIKRLCGYNMGEWRNSSYGGGAGGGAQKTFYCPYDMVYWLPDLSAP